MRLDQIVKRYKIQTYFDAMEIQYTQPAQKFQRELLTAKARLLTTREYKMSMFLCIEELLKDLVSELGIENFFTNVGTNYATEFLELYFLLEKDIGIPIEIQKTILQVCAIITPIIEELY
jgi:hypothetical protein